MSILNFFVETSGLNVYVIHRAILLEVVVWFVMLVAVYIDYRTGIRKARVLRIPKCSHGIRRSFTKFGDYCKVAGMLMLVDLLAIFFGVYSLPYGSAIAAAGVIYTEYRSVRENLAAIRSSAVKMTDIVSMLVEARDPLEITGLLKRYNDVKRDADKAKSASDENSSNENTTR